VSIRRSGVNGCVSAVAMVLPRGNSAKCDIAI
jgi:hypothetical protein